MSQEHSSQDQWTAVDNYITDLFIPPDPALHEALRASAEAHLPGINVTPNQGKLLMLLAKLHRAKRILEIGTLGGYSTIWLARALPKDGRLITLEYDPKHAEIARGNIKRAALADKVELIVGKALDSLPKLTGPFDLIFIDADKPNNPRYFEWSMKLTRPGGLILIDNVVRDGKVVEAGSNDEGVIGVRRMNEIIAAEPRVTATVIQTVGSKGYDGLAVVLVNE